MIYFVHKHFDHTRAVNLSFGSNIKYHKDVIANDKDFKDSRLAKMNSKKIYDNISRKKFISSSRDTIRRIVRYRVYKNVIEKCKY